MLNGELESFAEMLNNSKNIVNGEVIAENDLDLSYDDAVNYDSDGSIYLDSSFYTEDEDEEDSFIEYYDHCLVVNNEMTAMAA